MPARHAWAVQRLLDPGAILIGKTITDEVSRGIVGENAFYGTEDGRIAVYLTRAHPRSTLGSNAGSNAAIR